MKNTVPDTNSFAQRCRNTTVRLAFWTAAWVLATALASFGPRLLWDYSAVPTILGVLLQLGIGLTMILAHKKHIMALDDLMQKIQLQAMGISLGVGLVVGLSYELLEDIRLITFEPEISHLVMLMGMTYVGGVLFGNRRYR